MEKDSGYFRHHALFQRHLARHSGEDAGQAFRSVEDSSPSWHYGIHGGTIDTVDLPTELQERIGQFTGSLPNPVRDRLLPQAFRHPSTSLPAERLQPSPKHVPRIKGNWHPGSNRVQHEIDAMHLLHRQGDWYTGPGSELPSTRLYGPGRGRAKPKRKLIKL